MYSSRTAGAQWLMNYSVRTTTKDKLCTVFIEHLSHHFRTLHELELALPQPTAQVMESVMLLILTCHWLIIRHMNDLYWHNNKLWKISYTRGSVHRNSRLKKSNEMQQYADIYLRLNYSTCFERPSRPSSGVHKTVVADSGADHTMWEASFLKRDLIHLLLNYSTCFGRQSRPSSGVHTAESRWISSTYGKYI